MADEQKHLRLYCERMTELGIHLGDVPVIVFFWKPWPIIRPPHLYLWDEPYI